MYNPKLKEERIKAQLKSIGGLGFGFGKHVNKLKEILLDDEDIYGYLVGFNDESGNWEIMLCTNLHIYVLDKNGMFSVGYSQYDIRAFRGLNADSNVFRKYKVTIMVDHKKYVYSECQRGYVDLFRVATNYAKNSGELPYEFDRTPFLCEVEHPKQEERYESPRPKQPIYEEPENPILANDPNKFFKEQDKKAMDGSYPDSRNVFLYPEYKGEGFSYGDTIDDAYLEQAQVFIELAKTEPIADDFNYLDGNKDLVRQEVLKGDLESIVAFGRKGKLYLLKEQLGCKKIGKQDFESMDAYIEYVNRPTEKDFKKQENMVKNNHISSRFIDTPQEIEEDSFEDTLEFDIDFTKLNSISESSEDKFENVEIQENGKTRDFNLLVEYKELLDLGIITQTEFEKKKAEILNLND